MRRGQELTLGGLEMALSCLITKRKMIKKGQLADDIKTEGKL